MQLKLIKDEKCPTCGSHIVGESCVSVHSNGQGNEERRFACGAVIRWCPNAERLETHTICPKHPAEVSKRAKRAKAKADLIAYVKALDVDEDWKEHALRYL